MAAKIVETYNRLCNELCNNSNCLCHNVTKCLYSMSCGHLMCLQCLEKFNLNTEDQVQECPLCEQEVQPKETSPDELMNSLYTKTVELQNLLLNDSGVEVRQSIEKRDCLKSDNKASNTKQMKAMTDNKEVHSLPNEELTIKEEMIEMDKNKKATTKDKNIQPNESKFSSVEVQCNLIETQVESSEKVLLPVASRNCCCIKVNLKRILELNICDSFNAIIKGLLDADKCTDQGGKSSPMEVNDDAIPAANVPSDVQDVSQRNDAIPAESANATSTSQLFVPETQSQVALTPLPVVKSPVLEEKKLSSQSNVQFPVELFKSITKRNKGNKKKDLDANIVKVPKAKSASKHVENHNEVNKNNEDLNEDSIEITRTRRTRDRKVATKPINEDLVLDESSSKPTVKSKTNENKPLRKRKMVTPEFDNEEDNNLNVTKQQSEVASLPNDNEDSNRKKSKREVAQAKDDNDSVESTRVVEQAFKEPAKGKSAKKAKLTSIKDGKQTESESAINNNKSSTTIFNSSSSIMSSSTRSRQRSSSNEKKTFVIMNSGLDTAQKRKLEKAASVLDFETVTQWSSRITHLVVSCPTKESKKEMLTTRSLKYLMALMGNKWIVSFDWIIACVKSNRMVEEKKFEICGYRGCTSKDCPQQSRIQNGAFLNNCVFYFNGPFQKFNGDMNEIQTVVEVGRAMVANSQTDLASRMKDSPEMRFFVINDKDTDTVLPEFTMVTHLPINRLIDSISNLRKF